MRKIGLLSSKIILGFFDPLHPDALPHALHEKGGSTTNLSHFTLDYRCLRAACKKHAMDCQMVAWDSPNTDWSQYDAILIHTPWDYYEHLEDFLDTVARIDSQTLLLNSLKTVQWNIDKHYLRDLAQAGIPTIQTQFVDTSQTKQITDLMPEQGYAEGFIFKPTVSAGAADVYLVHTKEEAERIYQKHFLKKHRALMIQPFMKAIVEEGEWSFVFLNGNYSHGVLKKTEKGGIGVKHSTENKKHVPTQSMINQAIAIYQSLAKVNANDTLYTRIDVIKDKTGELLVMELEQIEPYLYLHITPHASDQLIEGIIERLRP